MNRYFETKVTESNQTEPVTLEQVQEWCSVTSSDYDNLLTDLIKVARKRVEKYTHLSLVAKTVVVTAYLCEKSILPFPIINSITSVEYLEGQELDGTNDWDVFTDDDYQLIGEQVKYFVPSIAGIYRITYTTLPFDEEDLLLDVKRVVNWMFRNRGDEQDAMPMSLMDNAKRYKIMTWG